MPEVVSGPIERPRASREAVLARYGADIRLKFTQGLTQEANVLLVDVAKYSLEDALVLLDSGLDVLPRSMDRAKTGRSALIAMLYDPAVVRKHAAVWKKLEERLRAPEYNAKGTAPVRDELGATRRYLNQLEKNSDQRREIAKKIGSEALRDAYLPFASARIQEMQGQESQRQAFEASKPIAEQNEFVERLLNHFHQVRRVMEGSYYRNDVYNAWERWIRSRDAASFGISESHYANILTILKEFREAPQKEFTQAGLREAVQKLCWLSAQAITKEDLMALALPHREYLEDPIYRKERDYFTSLIQQNIKASGGVETVWDDSLGRFRSEDAVRQEKVWDALPDAEKPHALKEIPIPDWAKESSANPSWVLTKDGPRVWGLDKDGNPRGPRTHRVTKMDRSFVLQQGMQASLITYERAQDGSSNVDGFVWSEERDPGAGDQLIFGRILNPDGDQDVTLVGRNGNAEVFVITPGSTWVVRGEFGRHIDQAQAKKFAHFSDRVALWAHRSDVHLVELPENGIPESFEFNGGIMFQKDAPERYGFVSAPGGGYFIGYERNEGGGNELTWQRLNPVMKYDFVTGHAVEHLNLSNKAIPYCMVDGVEYSWYDQTRSGQSGRFLRIFDGKDETRIPISKSILPESVEKLGMEVAPGADGSLRVVFGSGASGTRAIVLDIQSDGRFVRHPDDDVVDSTSLYRVRDGAGAWTFVHILNSDKDFPNVRITGIDPLKPPMKILEPEEFAVVENGFIVIKRRDIYTTGGPASLMNWTKETLVSAWTLGPQVAEDRVDPGMAAAMETMNLIRNPSLDGVKAWIAQLETAWDAQAMQKTPRERLGARTSMMLWNVYADHPEKFLEWNAAISSAPHAAEIVDRLLMLAFPQEALREQERLKPHQALQERARAFLNQVGKFFIKSEPSNIANAFVDRPVGGSEGGSAEDIADHRVAFELREPRTDFFVTRMYGAYDAASNQWESATVAFESRADASALPVTAMLPTVSPGDVVLPMPLGSAVIAERVHEKRSSGEMRAETHRNAQGLTLATVSPEAKGLSFSFTPPEVAVGAELTTFEYRQWRTLLAKSSPNEMGKLEQSIGMLPPEASVFLASPEFRAQSPKEQVQAIESWVRAQSYYDATRDAKIAKSLSELNPTQRFRAMQTRCADVGLPAMGKRFAGVCVDFAVLTCAMLRKAGFYAGLLDGFAVNGKSVQMSDRHEVAFVVWKDPQGRTIPLIVDGTPANTDPHASAVGQLSLAEREKQTHSASLDQGAQESPMMQRALDALKTNNINAIRALDNGVLERAMKWILSHDVRPVSVACIREAFDGYWYSPLHRLDLSDSSALRGVQGSLVELIDGRRNYAGREELAASPNPASGKLLFDVVRDFTNRLVRSRRVESSEAARQFIAGLVQLSHSALNASEQRAVVAILAYLDAKRVG